MMYFKKNRISQLFNEHRYQKALHEPMFETKGCWTSVADICFEVPP